MQNILHKKCSACGQVLPREAFPRDAAKPDRLHAYCRKCAAARSAQWRIDNPERYAHYLSNRRRKRLAGVLARSQQPLVPAEGVPVYVIADGEWQLIDVLLPGGGR